MHDQKYGNLSQCRFAPSWQGEPRIWSEMALLAMYVSPTMDGLTHHGHEMNAKRQTKFAQSVLGPCTPWEEEYTFLFMYQSVVLLESYFYDSILMNHS